jgi:thioredoxin 1
MISYRSVIVVISVLVMLLSGCGTETSGNLPCVNQDDGLPKSEGVKIENTTGLPIVMKVGRTTCVPCRTMSKLLGEMKPKLSGKASVEIVDIDEDPDAVKRYNVTGIPVTIFFDVSGNEVYRQIGLLDENEINNWLIASGMSK